MTFFSFLDAGGRMWSGANLVAPDNKSLRRLNNVTSLLSLADKMIHPATNMGTSLLPPLHATT